MYTVLIISLGRKLLEHILEHAASEKERNIKSVYLHVQTTNQEALSFYKNQGFEVTDTTTNYYKNIDDKDAHVLSKSIDPQQWLSITDIANTLVSSFSVFEGAHHPLYSHDKKLWIEKMLSIDEFASVPDDRAIRHQAVANLHNNKLIWNHL